ncbi:MAG: helix-turn-helix domain-containing protein [Limnohabitans sp.]
MTADTTISPPPQATAGVLLRQYREAHGLQLDTLAQALRVAPAKLAALEADRLSDLPDAMFARALTLAVCRQLKTDAAPVLALLPGQDVSRLAAKNERGLDFPLERPSLLPQSSFVVVSRWLTPVRWLALAIFALALVMGVWPTLHDLLVFKNDTPSDVVTTPVSTNSAVLPSTEIQPVTPDTANTNMVVTTVHSAALVQSAASAAAGASAAGAPDAR